MRGVLAVGIFWAVFAGGWIEARACGPVGGLSKQFCVTARLDQFHQASKLDDPNSADYKDMQQIALLELDRVVIAKNWKSRLTPPPQFVRFQNTSDPTNQIEALFHVWASADAATIQKELDPSGIALTPPPLYPIGHLGAVEGVCPPAPATTAGITTSTGSTTTTKA